MSYENFFKKRLIQSDLTMLPPLFPSPLFHTVGKTYFVSVPTSLTEADTTPSHLLAQLLCLLGELQLVYFSKSMWRCYVSIHFSFPCVKIHNLQPSLPMLSTSNVKTVPLIILCLSTISSALLFLFLTRSVFIPNEGSLFLKMHLYRCFQIQCTMQFTRWQGPAIWNALA